MFFKKIDKSCTLMTGMAERLGTHVPGTESVTSPASANALRSAVLRCAACKQHDACQSLQDKNPKLEAAPDYCRNW